MKTFLLIVAMTTTSLLYAQQQEKTFTGLGRVNAGIYGADISYDLPLSNKFVWANSLGIGMGSSAEPNTVNYYFDLAGPVPFINSELKFVYNAEKRRSAGLNTSLNSGNYVALATRYSFGRTDDWQLNRTLLTDVHWGIQRALGKRFIFNTHIGLGYLADFDNNVGSVSPTLGLRFGYKIF